MDVRLVQVRTEIQWTDYHSIRRSVLYELRGRHDYDDAHPDDRWWKNLPLLFTWQNQSVGTARLDLAEEPDKTGMLRMVAVLPTYQRRGIGTAMIAAVEQLAADKGLTELRVRAAPDAVAFYRKSGWSTAASQPSGAPLLCKRLPSPAIDCAKAKGTGR